MASKRKLKRVFEHELDKQFSASKPHKVMIFENNEHSVIEMIKRIDIDFEKLRLKVLNLRNRVVK